MSASQKQASDSARSSVRHGRLKKSSGWRTALKVGLAGIVVVAVSGVSIGAYAFWDLSSRMQPSVHLAGAEDLPEISNIGPIDGPLTIFLAGTDSRAGQSLDDGEEGELNDVNMLLTVSADHKTATVTSFPRDLMLPIPSCPGPNGEENYYPSMSEQPLNSTLQYGGLACAALTIQELTGIPINYAGLISFDGVIAMTNAIGGVPVCVSNDINDTMVGLTLPAGEHTLAGLDALQFLRSRYGVGDGGDLGRISNQQAFLSSLVRTIKSSETLGDASKVYGLAKATAENVSLSSSLNSITSLLSVAATVKDIDVDAINFVQYPVVTHPYNPNKVAPDYASASILFSLIEQGLPITLTGGTGPATDVDPNAPVAETPVAPTDDTAVAEDGTVPVDPAVPSEAVTAAPGELPSSVKGQNASQYTCTAGR